MAGRADQKQVSMYVSQDMYNWLSEDARGMGLSRAAFLRNVLDWWRSERESGRLGQDSAIRTSGTVERTDSLGAAERRIRELEAQLEGREELSSELTEARTRILTLEGDVRTLTTERQGLERVIEIQRDRQGMADSLNQELTTALNRLTRALPAAGESSGSSGFKWRFWRR